jgi:hypothetical protein
MALVVIAFVMHRASVGDPLSPMLFLPVMEALNALIRAADVEPPGEARHPGHPIPDFYVHR